MHFLYTLFHLQILDKKKIKKSFLELKDNNDFMGLSNLFKFFICSFLVLELTIFISTQVPYKIIIIELNTKYFTKLNQLIVVLIKANIYSVKKATALF